MRTSSGGWVEKKTIHPSRAVDLQRRQRLVLRVDQLAVGRQAPQRADHPLAAGERGAAAVGAELALPREPAR